MELRGSGAYDHIKELMTQNSIERKRQSEGRSYWLSLTEKFHRTFSVLPTNGPKAEQQGADSTTDSDDDDAAFEAA